MSGMQPAADQLLGKADMPSLAKTHRITVGAIDGGASAATAGPSGLN